VLFGWELRLLRFGRDLLRDIPTLRYVLLSPAVLFGWELRLLRFGRDLLRDIPTLRYVLLSPTAQIPR
jgi:hypothetical protein